jgi:hypothetical protein
MGTDDGAKGKGRAGATSAKGAGAVGGGGKGSTFDEAGLLLRASTPPTFARLLLLPLHTTRLYEYEHSL